MLAEVRLWGQVVGTVSLVPGETAADFECDPKFLRQGLEVAPLTMPLSPGVHRFPALRRESWTLFDEPAPIAVPTLRR